MSSTIFVLVSICLLTMFLFGGYAIAGKHIDGKIILPQGRLILTAAACTSLMLLVVLLVWRNAGTIDYINAWISTWGNITE
jgi:hypothetical protein